jgi:hypothetical protein
VFSADLTTLRHIRLPTLILPKTWPRLSSVHWASILRKKYSTALANPCPFVQEVFVNRFSLGDRELPLNRP